MMISVILFIAQVAAAFTPIQPGYNPFTHAVTCTARENCLHEVGHAADQRAGWISRTENWKLAVDTYRYMTWKYPETRSALSEKIHLFPGFGTMMVEDRNPLNSSFFGGWGGYTELYASLVQWSDGQADKCPQEFRQFYDWAYITQKMKDYEVSQ